jgi:hypothetical protein
MNETQAIPTPVPSRRRGRPPKIATPIVGEEKVQAAEPDASIASVPEQPKQEDPVAQFQREWTPVQIDDVVQIANNENKMLGLLFIVSDIRNHKIHGYYLLPNGKHEYVTVGEDEVLHVGPKTKGHIRSRNPCSPKWLTENK